MLEIESLDLDVDRAGGKVVWNRLGHVKRAQYDHFEFPYAAYSSIAGEPPNDVRLEARCTLRESVRAPASRPELQQPVEGFVHRTYGCEPIRIAE